MNDLVISVVPSIELIHDQPMVSSRTVAEHFRRSHAHVLRDIKALECSESFRRSNFGSSSYTTRQGKSQPASIMTRDGFMFLVMGYTGAAAARVKEAYIQRFNELEARYHVSTRELDYYRRRERELLASLRRNVRLQGQVIRLQKRMLRGAPAAVPSADRNQGDLFAQGAAA